jgi:OCT family organic cation transporter-like MFS transporter 4/5
VTLDIPSGQDRRITRKKLKKQYTQQFTYTSIMSAGREAGVTGALSSSRVRFEDILKLVGDEGRWQITIFLFTWIEGILIGFHHLSSSFLGASMGHWCNVDKITELDNLGWTLEQKKNYSIPFADDEFASCKRYDFTGQSSISSNFDVAMSQRSSSLPTVKCAGTGLDLIDQFQFDQTEGISSIVTDWQLVCDRLPYLSTVQGSYMGGVFVGCIVFGWASDKFGRRPTMLIAIAVQICATIITAFSVNYIMFIFFRFLVAFSVSGVFECGFVLVTEICGMKFRMPFGILTQFPFGIGAALMPLIAYFVREWSNLQLCISVPCVLLCSYFWFVPESPRWLVSKGRFDEALKILKGGAKINKKTLPSDNEILDMMEKIKQQDEEEVQDADAPKTAKEKVAEAFKELTDLVSTPEMRKRTLNVFFTWLAVAMVYYGLSFNTKNLGGNRYVSSFASGFVEMPAVVVIIPALATIGRVKCYSGTFISGGICCGLVAILSFALEKGSHVWAPVTVAMIGKFLISMTFAIAYLYTAELFPTSVRNVAVGAASTFARIGSMSAPYIVDLLGAVHAGIPAIIFGIVATIAGLLSLMLPETLNRKMPESVAEIERSAKKKYHDAEEMNTIPASTE